jgi:hypothetical protein
MGEDGAWSPEIPKVSANVTAGNSEAKDGPSTEMNASEGEQDSQSTASFGRCDPKRHLAIAICRTAIDSSGEDVACPTRSVTANFPVTINPPSPLPLWLWR